MNRNLSVSQTTESASTTSVNASTDARESETPSYDCSPGQQQSDSADRQTGNVNASALSQCQSNETTAGAAFYCHPGSDCYESFGDIVKNANKTSELCAYYFYHAACVTYIIFSSVTFCFIFVQRVK